MKMENELPLYPKKTKRGGTCYYRDWYPYCDLYVVKPKDPFANRSSSATIGIEISRDELLKLDKRFRKG